MRNSTLLRSTILLFLMSSNLLLAQMDSTKLKEGHHLYFTALMEANENNQSESIFFAEKAMKIFKSIEAWNDYEEAYGLIARNYVQLGDFEKAIQITNEVKELIQVKGLNHPHHYLIVNFISGTINHEKGLYLQAINCFEATLDILKSEEPMTVLWEPNPTGEDLQIFKDYTMGHTYNYAGFPLLGLGEYDKAISYFKNSKRHYEAAGRADDILNSYINIGSAYLAKGDIDSGLSWFNAIVKILEPRQNNIPLLAAGYSYLYKSYKLKNDFPQEKIYLEKLKKLFDHPDIDQVQEVTGTSKETIWLSILASEAINQARQGLIAEAIQNAKKTLAQLKKRTLDQEIIAQNFRDVGEAFYLSGEYEKALESCQHGLALLNPGLNREDVFQNPEPRTIDFKLISINLLSLEVKALFQLYSNSPKPRIDGIKYLQIALSTAEFNVEILEDVRTHLIQAAINNISGEGALLNLEKKYTRAFDQAIEMADALFQLTKEDIYMERAFRICEKSKSFILRQALDKIERIQGFPDSLRKKIRNMSKEVFFFKKQIAIANGEGDRNKMNSIERQLFALEEQQKDFIKSLKSNPDIARYYNEQYNFETVSLKDVQKIIRQQKSMAMLEVYEHADKIYTFFITADQSQMFSCEKPKDWAEDIEWLKKKNVDFNLIYDEEMIRKYLEVNHRIYKLLFRNGLEFINASTNRLIIIPHGMSHHINFNLLLKTAKEPTSHAIQYLDYKIVDCTSLDFLIWNYGFGYAHSSSIWVNEMQKPRDNGPFDFDFIGFAPAYKNRKQAIAELPDEISQLKYLFKSSKFKTLKGKDVTELKFRNHTEKYSSKILHISAHGEINDRFPLASKLLLASNPKKESRYDDNLEIGELYNMRINTQLAILSACNTGVGDFAGGSGKINLARGFAYANCPGIIMSLWDLDAEMNLQIIKRLYHHLIKAQLPVDQALRQAQLDYLKKQQKKWKKSKQNIPQEQEKVLLSMHPYFWAGLVSIGRTDRLIID